MMTQSRAESTWEINDYGRFINQFLPKTIRWIRQYERINKKICRQKISIMFNEIYIYIYIYIYICEWDVFKKYQVWSFIYQKKNNKWNIFFKIVSLTFTGYIPLNSTLFEAPLELLFWSRVTFVLSSLFWYSLPLEINFQLRK